MHGDIEHDQVTQSSFRSTRELPPDAPAGMTLRAWRRAHVPHRVPQLHHHRWWAKRLRADRGDARDPRHGHSADRVDPAERAVQAMLDWQARVARGSIYR